MHWSQLWEVEVKSEMRFYCQENHTIFSFRSVVIFMMIIVIFTQCLTFSGWLSIFRIYFLCVLCLQVSASAQPACASAWCICSGPWVCQRGGYCAERQHAYQRAPRQPNPGKGQHLQLCLQVCHIMIVSLYFIHKRLVSVSNKRVWPAVFATCSFLCRSVAVDSSNRVAILQLTHKTDLLLQTSTTSFMLVKEIHMPIITWWPSNTTCNLLIIAFFFCLYCSTKCTWCLQKSSLLSTSSRRCFVFLLMVASLKTRKPFKSYSIKIKKIKCCSNAIPQHFQHPQAETNYSLAASQKVLQDFGLFGKCSACNMCCCCVVKYICFQGLIAYVPHPTWGQGEGLNSLFST